MEYFEIVDFLNSVDMSCLNFEDFRILGNATSLSNYTGEQLEFYRGPLLYALIRFLKPKQILEFGTGGGYSTLCMAKSLSDNNIDGKIYTIDRVGNDEKITRFYKLPNNKSIQKNKISNREIWELIAKKTWIEKIIPIRGYSGVVMEKLSMKNIDFCYIDGVHTYDGAKHDFFSFLKISSKKFSIVFDDYIERDFYGVKEFIDSEVAPHFNLKLIQSDPENNLKQFVTTTNAYGMVYLKYDSEEPAINNYDKSYVDSFLKSYRTADLMIRSKRYELEKCLPFLKNIKFKFWR